MAREVSFDEGMALTLKLICKFWEVSEKPKNNLKAAFYEGAKLIRMQELADMIQTSIRFSITTNFRYFSITYNKKLYTYLSHIQSIILA